MNKYITIAKCNWFNIMCMVKLCKVSNNVSGAGCCEHQKLLSRKGTLAGLAASYLHFAMRLLGGNSPSFSRFAEYEFPTWSGIAKIHFQPSFSHHISPDIARRAQKYIPFTLSISGKGLQAKRWRSCFWLQKWRGKNGKPILHLIKKVKIWVVL